MTKAESPIYKVSFRRRREGKTDYKKRLALVKSDKVRMVVRRSNKFILVQFIKFEPNGDKTLVGIDGPKMNKLFGWQSKRNVWSAYLTGLYAGKQAQKGGVKEFVFDTGRYTSSKGSVIFAALKGALDSGLKTNTSDGTTEKMPLDKIDNPPEAMKGGFEETKKKIMA